MCMTTYIHAYAHAQAHVHIHMPFHLHVHIHAYIYIYVLDIDIMYACTYTGMHACMYALNACMFVSIRVSACARMGVGVVVSPCQCERTIILPVRAKVCVCVYTLILK